MSRLAHRPAALAAASVLLIAALAPAPRAQADADPVWIATTPDAPEDTPAEINLVPTASGDQQTMVEVVIHGFWQEDVVGDDGATYQRIRVPGLPSYGQPGAPELPVARFAVAVPTDAEQLVLAAVDETDVVTFEGVDVYPSPIPGSDEEYDPTEDPGPGDTQGTDEVFTKDDAIYGLTTAWPQVPDTGPVEITPLFAGIPGGACQVHPVTFDPSKGTLRVATNTLYAYAHPGTLTATPPATIKKIGLASKVFVNWPSVGFGFPANTDAYQGRYLIVTRSSYFGSLGFFVLHKTLLGYDVEIAIVPPQDVIAAAEAIEAWYAQGEPQMDHFVLLVGDVDTIPLFDKPFVGETDDVYGSIDGNFYKEAHVGRLSVDSTSDLVEQLQKIIDYERFPVLAGAYDDVVLVAHDEDAPFKYTAAHLTVASKTYATSPDFLLELGFTGATDESVRARIDAGVGLVAYRGHGATNAWTDWNPDGDDFHKNDILDLENTDTIKPIVWSFSCTNSNVTYDADSKDCFGEAWLEADDVGGVAHYGATSTTWTSFNHVLDERLFEFVYDSTGAPAHGMVLDATELAMWVAGWQGKNAWLYMLLGDPAMTVRREAVEPIFLTTAVELLTVTDDGETTDVAFEVLSSAGLPLSGAQVSLYKASLIPGAEDEVLTNVYADDLGRADFVIELATPGTLHVSVQDGLGNTAFDEIPVGLGKAWTQIEGGAPGSGGTPSLVGTGSLSPGTPMSLILTEAASGAPTTLIVGLSELGVPFKGGLLVPSVDLLIPGLATDAQGALVLGAPWPDSVPAGVSLYFQAWITDAGAPQGLAGSNGLSGTTP